MINVSCNITAYLDSVVA